MLLLLCCRFPSAFIGGYSLVRVQGKIMADTAMEAKDTPLQIMLEDMATHIGTTRPQLCRWCLAFGGWVGLRPGLSRCLV